MTGDIPPLVPLQCALEFLHTGDVEALRRPPRYSQHYDSKTRDRLLQRLAQSGARVRGNIDGAPESWIESLELLNDFRVGYWYAMRVGRIACLESRIAYAADLVRDHSSPVQHPAAVKPNYRRIVRNVKVETASLLLQAAHTRWRAKIKRECAVSCLPPPGRLWWPWQIARRRPVKLVAQTADRSVIALPVINSDVKPATASRQATRVKGRQSLRALAAMDAKFPNGVPNSFSTDNVHYECTVWLENDEPKGPDGKIPKPPGIDVYARLLGRRIDRR
jgi:hypothetical protein